MPHVKLDALADTQKLASMCAKHAQRGDVLLLRGDLGAGKTAFARAFIRAYVEEAVDVPSPTFALLQQYDARKKAPVWHYDLYRIEDESELVELALEDALDMAVTLIEWPDIARGVLPGECLEIQFSCDKSGEQRNVELVLDKSWKQRLGDVF